MTTFTAFPVISRADAYAAAAAAMSAARRQHNLRGFPSGRHLRTNLRRYVRQLADRLIEFNAAQLASADHAARECDTGLRRIEKRVSARVAAVLARGN